MRRNFVKPGEYRETLSIYAKYSQTQAMRIIHLHGKVYPAPLEKHIPPKNEYKKGSYSQAGGFEESLVALVTHVRPLIVMLLPVQWRESHILQCYGFGFVRIRNYLQVRIPIRI
jgi:hypothetical protein